jgi:hypothetical protein
VRRRHPPGENPMITHLAARISTAVARARLAMAEHDLDWMERIGQQNLARQRRTVQSLRNRLQAQQTRITAADVVRNAERTLKTQLLGGRA